MMGVHLGEMKGAEFNAIAAASASVLIVKHKAQSRMTRKRFRRTNINTCCISAMQTILLAEKPAQRAVVTEFLEYNSGPGMS